jgi:hypothetical protein
VIGILLFAIAASEKPKKDGVSPILFVVGCLAIIASAFFVRALGKGLPASTDLLTGVPYCTEWSAKDGDSQQYLLKNTIDGQRYFMTGKVALPAGCFVKTTDGRLLEVAPSVVYSHPAPPTK